MKALVLANCQGEGRNLEAGTVLDIDENNRAEKAEAAQLYAAGRIVDDTPENRARFQRENPQRHTATANTQARK